MRYDFGAGVITQSPRVNRDESYTAELQRQEAEVAAEGLDGSRIVY